MRYLLDTHVFNWLDSEPDKLSPKIASLCADRANQLVLSLASIWEIQIKFQLGKLKLNKPLITLVKEQQSNNQIELLPVTVQHILSLDKLPAYHRDPFDRILVAQAISEELTFITHDSVIKQYPIKIEW